MTKTTPLQTGLLLLQGNRLEWLADAVFDWTARHPLGPLEEETFLVASNGMAEWLKIRMAQSQGVCAAVRVELPARFMWRAWRAVLGRGAVPATSALDELALTWRLMALLPGLAGQAPLAPHFDPVAGFLQAGDADPLRRLQLAQRLADLFDQYQVYRGDWLDDWAAGHDRLRPAAGSPAGAAVPVPPPQRWQPAVWRAVLAGLDPDEQQAARPLLHRRFVAALQEGRRSAGAGGPRWPALPRRIVVFGTTHVPQQTLEAVTELASHCQVIVAAPNPCRVHWADDAGHPLLAAWGRQGRDFIRQLDAHDEARGARDLFALPRIDLFDTEPSTTLLRQLQAAIRDGVPLAEQAAQVLPPQSDDRSIVFHVAHGPQREVEILHDQLLRLFEHPPGSRALEPRDVVVMVPDVEAFAPAIAAVFGQHVHDDPRRIPWAIADRSDRGHHPLLVALEWLLRVPTQRFAASELRTLLDVPAVARRHGIAPTDLPTLLAWIEGAGIRWGLDEAHRSSLGLGACGDANTWHAGLQRMLLGYATGLLPAGHGGIDPYVEVGGLEAGLVGALAELVGTLQRWWQHAASSRTPKQWAQALRKLVADLFAPDDPAERALLTAADAALGAWLDACERGGFGDAVELAVAREAWLGAIDAASAGIGGGARRFHAGGVTFCTLLPLRAIPFEVVCLLGMNDGDYPRRAPRSDFDLMALPGQSRPGDRSRRDDDRQLMLDALLSARQVLYVSWTGRSARDNVAEPPSVLVSQLRDHLATVVGKDELARRTTEHPLQPFSSRYFESVQAGSTVGAAGLGRARVARSAKDGALFTYAAEWRAAHEPAPSAVPTAAPSAVPAAPPPAVAEPITLMQLARFVRNPVRAFFRHRLQVAYDEAPPAIADDESFSVAGLDRWRLLDSAVQRLRAALPSGAPPADEAALQGLAAAQAGRLRRAGCLPLAGPGDVLEAEIAATLLPMLRRWQALRAAHPHALPAQPLRLAHPTLPGLAIDDWLGALAAVAVNGAPVWIDLQAARVAADAECAQARVDKLVLPWLRCLAAAASGLPAGGFVVGADAVLAVRPPPRHEAEQALRALLQAWHDGVLGNAPLPTAVATGLAHLGHGKPRKAYEGDDRVGGEVREPCLARLFPDFDALSAAAGFEAATRRLYEPLQAWARESVEVEPLPGARPGAEGVGDG